MQVMQQNPMRLMGVLRISSGTDTNLYRGEDVEYIYQETSKNHYKIYFPGIELNGYKEGINDYVDCIPIIINAWLSL